MIVLRCSGFPELPSWFGSLLRSPLSTPLPHCSVLADGLLQPPSSRALERNRARRLASPRLLSPVSKDFAQPARFDGNNDRDRVLEGTNLVELVGESIHLKPKGREWVGLCPFHADRTPSFSVITHKGPGFYHCFACGAGGNCFDFMMNYHRMEFLEALKFLAARINFELTPRTPIRRAPGEPSRDEVIEANRLALKYFRRILSEPAGENARAEATKRGYDLSVVDQFELGASADRSDGLLEAFRRASADATRRAALPPIEAFVAAGLLRPSSRGDGHYDFLRNRLIFPIFDELGRPIAFGGRRIKPEDEPKYVNSPESPVFHKSRTLYALHQARRSIIEKGLAIVTEGYTDVIACHRAGYTNAVATLGTAFTREHAAKLESLAPRVTLLFDGDEAGQKAADRSIEVFFQVKIDVRICTLPDRLDPDEILKQAGGSERFEAALERGVSALDFMLSRLRKQAQMCDGISETQALAERTALRLAELGFVGMSGIRRQLVLDTLAPTLRVAPQVLEQEILAHAAKLRGRPRPVETRSTRSDETSSIAVETPAATVRTPKERAQISAQGHLLAPLVSAPELASTVVSIGGEGSLPISEALLESDLVLPEHRLIWRAIAEAAESNKPLSFAALLSLLEHANANRAARELVLELKEILRPRSKVSVTPMEPEPTIDELRAALRSAWKTLEDLRQRHRTQMPTAVEGNASPSRRLGSDGLDGRSLEALTPESSRDAGTERASMRATTRASGVSEVRGVFFQNRSPSESTESAATTHTVFLDPQNLPNPFSEAHSNEDGSTQRSPLADSVSPVQPDSLAETRSETDASSAVCSSADAWTATRLNNMRARGADPTAIRRLPKSGNPGANP